MLLIVISQNLVDAYERVLELLIQQFNELHAPLLSQYRDTSKTLSPNQSLSQQQSMTVPSMGHLNDEIDNGPLGMKLYEYEVGEEEESAVFGGVMRLQLVLLQSFLARIRDVLISSKWNAHLALVEAAGNKIKKQLALFNPDCKAC